MTAASPGDWADYALESFDAPLARLEALRAMAPPGDLYVFPDQPRAPINGISEMVVRDRAQGRCECCGQPGRTSMHHTRYHFLAGDGMPRLVFGLESPDDLLALCRRCHHARHRPEGRFVFEPDFLLEPQKLHEVSGRHLSELLCEDMSFSVIGSILEEQAKAYAVDTVEFWRMACNTFGYFAALPDPKGAYAHSFHYLRNCEELEE